MIALHGTPGSGLKFAGNHAVAQRLRLRLICPDRWGYGGSNPPPTPTLAAYADDIAELADAVALERFALLGVSGGGPFAAVAAARLGARVTRTALVCPVGPVAAVAAYRISPFHRFSFGVLPRLPGAVRLTFAAYRALVMRAPDVAARLAAARAGADDRRLMRDRSVRAGLAAAFRDGLASGVDGCVIDMTLFARPWDVEPLRSRDGRVWIGLDDGNVPLEAARELARLSGAELTELPGRGHFWIAEEDAEVWRWLACRP